MRVLLPDRELLTVGSGEEEPPICIPEPRDEFQIQLHRLLEVAILEGRLVQLQQSEDQERIVVREGVNPRLIPVAVEQSAVAVHLLEEKVGRLLGMRSAEHTSELQ